MEYKKIFECPFFYECHGINVPELPECKAPFLFVQGKITCKLTIEEGKEEAYKTLVREIKTINELKGQALKGWEDEISERQNLSELRQ